MEERNGNQTKSPSVNQPTPNIQPPPTEDLTQPTNHTTKPTQPGFVQSAVDQQPVSLQSSEEKVQRPWKKLLLIFLGSVLVFIVIIVSFFLLLSPTVEDLTVCLNESSDSSEELFRRAATEKWNGQQACAAVKPVREKLIACYEQAGSGNLLHVNLAFFTVGLIDPNLKDLKPNDVVRNHNLKCSEYPETLISI
jgi:hypothetical protein